MKPQNLWTGWRDAIGLEWHADLFCSVDSTSKLTIYVRDLAHSTHRVWKWAPCKAVFTPFDSSEFLCESNANGTVISAKPGLLLTQIRSLPLSTTLINTSTLTPRATFHFQTRCLNMRFHENENSFTVLRVLKYQHLIMKTHLRGYGYASTNTWEWKLIYGVTGTRVPTPGYFSDYSGEWTLGRCL